MKHKILFIIVMILLSSCALSPVAHDPVKKDKSIKEVEIPDVFLPENESKINVSKTDKVVPKEMIEYSLNTFKINKKKNGVLITLDYNGDDPKKNITTFFSGDNFFNITFYKGRFSGSVKNYIYNKAIVGSVKFFEFENSVQITLRLKKDHKSSYIDTNNKQITISVFN